MSRAHGWIVVAWFLVLCAVALYERLERQKKTRAQSTAEHSSLEGCL